MAKDKLSSVDTSLLESELKRRKRDITRLTRKRDRLLSQLREVEQEIRDFGGVAALTGEPGRKRPRNEQNLADSLATVLDGKTMSVRKLTDEVQRQGYATTSPNFRTIVNQTLLKDSRFKRVSRGQYTVKSSASRSGGSKSSGSKSSASRSKRSSKKKTTRRRSR